MRPVRQQPLIKQRKEEAAVADSAEIVSTPVPGSVAEATERFTARLKERGLTVFAVIDQAEAARSIGLELRATTLVVFGSPAVGTPIMAETPLTALDLPLKVLLWDDGGTTQAVFYDPIALAVRHGASAEAVGKLNAVRALVQGLAQG